MYLMVRSPLGFGVVAGACVEKSEPAARSLHLWGEVQEARGPVPDRRGLEEPAISAGVPAWSCRVWKTGGGAAGAVTRRRPHGSVRTFRRALPPIIARRALVMSCSSA